MAGKDKKQKVKKMAAVREEAVEGRLSVSGYIILNLIFWAYCAVQLLVLKWLLRDVAGLYVFFAILAVAFTVVSLYDFLYDRLSKQALEPGTSTTSSQDT